MLTLVALWQLENEDALCYFDFVQEITDARRLTPSPSAASLHAGDVRRFGPDGVLYEIVKLPAKGDKAMIRVFDTDEELAYAICKILADPVD